MAAGRGAHVTGVDPAERLRQVAAGRAHRRKLDVAFIPGEAGALPVPDASADIVLSVFGAIFAPDARAAVAEMARIASPRARVVLTAWIPGGAIGAVARTCREAVTKAIGAPPGSPPFPGTTPRR